MNYCLILGTLTVQSQHCFNRELSIFKALIRFSLQMTALTDGPKALQTFEQGNRAGARWKQGFSQPAENDESSVIVSDR